MSAREIKPMLLERELQPDQQCREDIAGILIPPGCFVRDVALPQDFPAAAERIKAAPRCAPGWIQKLTALWRTRSENKLEDTLRLGSLVRQWRESLRAHGQWADFWHSHGRDLPFRKRKAEQLILVGEALADNPNVHVRAHLPSESQTLYCLAELGSALVDKLVRQGCIHPGMTLSDAKELLAEHKPKKKQKLRSTPKKRLARFAKFIQSGSRDWSPKERRLIKAKLLSLAEGISVPDAAREDA